MSKHWVFVCVAGVVGVVLLLMRWPATGTCVLAATGTFAAALLYDRATRHLAPDPVEFNPFGDVFD